MDRFFPASIKQIPLDGVLYEVRENGKVKIVANRSGPLWEVTLEPIGGDVSENTQSLVFNVSYKAFSFFPVGARFKNGRQVAFSKKSSADYVVLDFAAQEFVLRLAEPPLTFLEHNQENLEKHPDAVSYTRIPVLAGSQVDFAFVRASEIKRFYYGARISLLCDLFNFAGDAVNSRLYSRRLSRELNEDTYGLYSSTRLLDSDKKYLGNYIANAFSRKALTVPAVSARSQLTLLKGNWRRPRAMVPVGYQSEWQVIGVRRSFNSNGETSEGLMISRIQSCSAEPTYTYVKDLQPVPEKNSEKKGKRRPREILPYSSKPPRIDFNKTGGEDLDLDLILLNVQNLSQPNYDRVGFGKLIDSDMRSDPAEIKIPTIKTIKDLGGIGGPGGEDNTGNFDPKNMPPKKDYEPVKKPEIDKEALEGLFADLSDIEADLKLVQYYEADPRLQTFSDAVRSLQSYSDLDAYFYGSDGGDYDPDTIPIFSIVTSQNGSLDKLTIQTGSVLVVRYRDRSFFFFEMTPKPKQTIAMHVMNFRETGFVLTPIKAAKIFHVRINSNQGWPQRDQYREDFYTTRVKHKTIDSAENMATRITKAVAALV